MAKLIQRSSERTLMRRRGEPAYSKWSEWELCEGSEGLNPAELKRLAYEWHAEDERHITGSGDGWEMAVRDPYCRQQYRCVADGFDVADYNRRLKE